MSRLLLYAGLISFLSVGCASRHSVVDDEGVVQSTSQHRRSNDDWTRDLVYLRVATGAPDAVLYAEPDQWADVVAQLEFSQWLVVVDSARGLYVQVRTVGHEVDVEGWVWAAAVQRSMPRGYPPGEEVWEDEGASYELRSRDWPGPVAIEPVDLHETALAEMNGDSKTLLRHFREFGEAGGLSAK